MFDRRVMSLLAAGLALSFVVVVLDEAPGDAAADVVVVKDANSSRKAQVTKGGSQSVSVCRLELSPGLARCATVDNGRLRVGDGRGALTVNGTIATRHPHPVRLFGSLAFGATDETASDDFYTVPVGMRLITTFVSVSIQLPSGQDVVASVASGADPGAYVRLDDQGAFGSDHYLVGSQPFGVTYEAGETVRLEMRRSATGGSPVGEIVLSGHLEGV